MPRILLIRPTALGDVARTVPALVSLRRAWPNAHIDWLVNDAFEDVVRHHPMLDGVVAFPRKRFGQVVLHPAVLREMLRWARSLGRPGYDLAVDLQGLLRSGLFTWLTGAARRVGYANARELGWLGYNRRHAIDRKLHAVDRMLALLQAEGVEPVRDLRLYVGQEDRAWFDAWRERVGLGDRPFACLAPTARWRCKCWPIDRYGAIARKLLDSGRAGEHLVILASPAEQAQVQPLLDHLEPAYRQRVHLPVTRVGQMMAILASTSLLVANDSAPLHIAVGFDRPLVALFGPTDPALVGPYRRDDAVLRPAQAAALGLHYRDTGEDQSLISQLTVEEVWRAIERQWA